MARLLDLPNELVVKIFSNLTHRDLIACQLSNKQLYTIIKDSVLLQFQIALSTFKATDNPSCPLNITERFQALKDSEDAWSYLRHDLEQPIALNDQMSNIYDLTGGVFIFWNVARTAFHYIRLPSSIEDRVEWKKIQLDHNEDEVLGMGVCLYEHDLLVVVKSGLQNTTYDIELVLLKLSTEEPHPAAKESTIPVLHSKWDNPEIGVEIVGDHLVLILSYEDDERMPHDRVFVYDWRNAVQKMSFEAPCCSYSRLVFLSENLVVMPNAQANNLEIWDISSTPQPPRPNCILQLPELATGDRLVSITCRGEPNPIGSQSQFQPHKPFHQSAHEAIILFHIRVQLRDPLGHQQQHGGELTLECPYTLFVHRKALHEVYERHCADINNKPRDVHSISVQLEDSGLGDSGLVDDDGSDGWESTGSDNEDDIPVRATHNDPIPIPWSSWGPHITRLFPADNYPTRWITTTSGQRAVLISRYRPGALKRYLVLDFNPENVRRMEKKLVSLPLDCRSRIRCYHDVGFMNSAVGGLPFVSCASEDRFYWDGALMDGERIIGIQLDDDGNISDIEILYFG